MKYKERLIILGIFIFFIIIIFILIRKRYERFGELEDQKRGACERTCDSLKVNLREECVLDCKKALTNRGSF